MLIDADASSSSLSAMATAFFWPTTTSHLPRVTPRHQRPRLYDSDRSPPRRDDQTRISDPALTFALYGLARPAMFHDRW